MVTGISNLHEGGGVPGVDMNDLDERGRHDGLELHEEIVVLGKEVLVVLQHIPPAKDLSLRGHVKAPEGLGPVAAVASGRGHDVLVLFKQLDAQLIHTHSPPPSPVPPPSLYAPPAFRFSFSLLLPQIRIDCFLGELQGARMWGATSSIASLQMFVPSSKL